MGSDPRFLEKFWSLHLIGRMGAMRAIGYSLLGLLRLLGLLLFLLGLGWLLAWAAPEIFRSIVSFLVAIVIGLLGLRFIWRMLRSIF